VGKARWHLVLGEQVEKGDQRVGSVISAWGLLGSGLKGIDRNRRASDYPQDNQRDRRTLWTDLTRGMLLLLVDDTFLISWKSCTFLFPLADDALHNTSLYFAQVIQKSWDRSIRENNELDCNVS
jgi:hypothetical protein